MASTKTIRLGDLVKDQVTGYTGVVVARTEYLNGCVRLLIQPQKLDKDGKSREPEAYDIEQCVLVKDAVVKRPEKEPTGGPRPAVPARRDATRYHR